MDINSETDSLNNDVIDDFTNEDINIDEGFDTDETEESEQESEQIEGGISEIEKQKKQMKGYVDEFCKVDDEIRQLKLAVKERDKRLKELKSLIGNFMANNSVDFFNLQTGGSLSYKQTMKFKSLNKNQTLELYSMFLGDKEKAVKLLEFLKTNREKIPSSNLVRKIN